MIIDLKSIQHSPRHFDLTLGRDWWEGDGEQILGFDSPLDVDLTISEAEGRYLVKGHLAGDIVLRCGRCLETFTKKGKYHINLTLTTVPPDESDIGEIELSEDDMSTDFTVGDEIDLHDIIREQIYLNTPIRCLCRSNCLGLCAGCGVNLNVEPCRCNDKLGHPGFMKLKDLRLSGE
ncbi:MAG: DUF177 domain-containing protein [Thermodesulfobacteriota bacterium]|nr:DUF177 domain-containing protein [Thermodesulfobacteriota bacterium]